MNSIGFGRRIGADTLSSDSVWAMNKRKESIN